ncbi:hypothetical protein DVJ77_14470 [Dyella tabacisoli]|uniref:Uncharacterized protein n=2 Tax=Dyella tabacisoli TaxID=2282381 RepID=A0A369UMT7_9GAMM|nr:hypothetical protein DVJ77_14470 [Dyella tabacisoli]
MAIAGVFFSPTSKAQETGQTKNMEAVTVLGISNPQELDLRAIKKSTRRFTDMPTGQREKVSLSYYLHFKKPFNPVDLELVLIDGDSVQALKVRKNNQVVLPHGISNLSKEARIISNVEKKSFSIIYKIDIQPDANGPTTIGYLRDAIKQARAAWKKEYGMGAVMVPKFDCATFKFATQQVVSINSTPGSVDSPLWSSRPGMDIDVHVADANYSDDAVVSWDNDQLMRIATCKWKAKNE